MKASELIKELQGLIDRWGDLEVVTNDDHVDNWANGVHFLQSAEVASVGSEDDGGYVFAGANEEDHAKLSDVTEAIWLV